MFSSFNAAKQIKPSAGLTALIKGGVEPLKNQIMAGVVYADSPHSVEAV